MIKYTFTNLIHLLKGFLTKLKVSQCIHAAFRSFTTFLELKVDFILKTTWESRQTEYVTEVLKPL